MRAVSAVTAGLSRVRVVRAGIVKRYQTYKSDSKEGLLDLWKCYVATMCFDACEIL